MSGTPDTASPRSNEKRSNARDQEILPINGSTRQCGIAERTCCHIENADVVVGLPAGQFDTETNGYGNVGYGAWRVAQAFKDRYAGRKLLDVAVALKLTAMGRKPPIGLWPGHRACTESALHLVRSFSTLRIRGTTFGAH